MRFLLLSTFKTRQKLEYWLIRAFDYKEYISVMNEHYLTPALTEYLYDKTEILHAEMIAEGLIAID